MKRLAEYFEVFDYMYKVSWELPPEGVVAEFTVEYMSSWEENPDGSRIPAELEKVLDGGVKWDGCVNWASGGYAHNCTARELGALTECLRYVYVRGLQLLGKMTTNTEKAPSMLDMRWWQQNGAQITIIPITEGRATNGEGYRIS